MSARLMILMYHGIGGVDQTVGTRYICPVNRFSAQLAYLRSAGYTPLSLGSAVDSLISGTGLPEKAVAITFDDGYQDNYVHALPLLLHHGIPATVFVVSGHVGGHDDWRPPHAAASPLLTWEQLREMQRLGIDIGAHTRHHPYLPGVLRPEAIREEIAGSKAELEDRLGEPVLHFAYPYGGFDGRVRDLTEAAGFTAACSTRSGFNRPGADPFCLRRIEIYGDDTLRRFRRKLTFGGNDGSWAVPFRYYYRRLSDRLGIRGRDRSRS